MKPASDEPRLTAYVLGECPPDEAAAIARAIAADPALAIAVREIEAVERMLSATFHDGEHTLSARQRGAILTAARTAEVVPMSRPQPRPRRIAHWLVPFSAAALILLGIFLFIPDDPPATTADAATSESPAVPISMLPAPGPADASTTRRGSAPSPAAMPPPITTGGHPVLQPRGPVSAAHHPMLRLPIQSGRASYGWISGFIRQDGKLPPADAVRTEEILNHFRIRPVGATAIHRGITLTAETVPSPWNPNATLAIIAIRGARESLHEFTTTWQADAAAVWRYRLIGHAVPVGAEPRPLARTLAAAAEHVVVLEIEPSSPTQRGFGSIEWTVDGEPAPSLAVARNPTRTPSVDARFAAFVCAVAEWLRQSAGTPDTTATEASNPTTGPAPTPPASLDAGMVAAALREIQSDLPAPDRTDFLNLARQALALASDNDE